MQIIAEDQLDALAYPHQQCIVVPLGERQLGRKGVVASVTGLPRDRPIGVPVGIEFLGRPWSEPALIRIAYAFEQATAVSPATAKYPPLAVNGGRPR